MPRKANLWSHEVVTKDKPSVPWSGHPRVPWDQGGSRSPAVCRRNGRKGEEGCWRDRGGMKEGRQRDAGAISHRSWTGEGTNSPDIHSQI